MGIDARAGNPEPPLCIEIHIDRLGDQGVGCIKVYLEALRRLELAQLDPGVRLRRFPQVPLRLELLGGKGQKGKSDKDQASWLSHLAPPFTLASS